MLRFDKPAHGGSLIGLQLRDVSGAAPGSSTLTVKADIMDDMGVAQSTFLLMLSSSGDCVGLANNDSPHHHLDWFRTIEQRVPGALGLAMKAVAGETTPEALDRLAALLVELGMLPAGTVE